MKPFAPDLALRMIFGGLVAIVVILGAYVSLVAITVVDRIKAWTA